MLYLLSSDDTVKNILSDYSLQLINRQYNFEKESFMLDDILIVDIDEFNSVENVMNYFNTLPSLLKTIALISKPQLSHGAFLIKKGFKSYLGKETNKEIVNIAIESVRNENVWLYPQLMNFIIQHISIEKDESKSLENLEQLTEKERKVALLVSNGLSNKEIANEMDVQLVTIKKHIGHIFTKLDVKDRLSLALYINQ